MERKKIENTLDDLLGKLTKRFTDGNKIKFLKLVIEAEDQYGDKFVLPYQMKYTEILDKRENGTILGVISKRAKNQYVS